METTHYMQFSPSYNTHVRGRSEEAHPRLKGDLYGLVQGFKRPLVAARGLDVDTVG